MGERQTISLLFFLSLDCQSMALQSPWDQSHTLWLDIQTLSICFQLNLPSHYFLLFPTSQAHLGPVS